MLPGLCIIVVNFGSHDLIDANFSPLDGLAHVLIVDNMRSEADSTAIGRVTEARGWQLISMPSNIGFGPAVNAGVAAAAAAGFTTVMVVNPDVRMTRSAVTSLAALSASRPGALISPIVLKPDGTTWFCGASVRVDAGRTANSLPRAGTDDEAWVSGACMVTSTRWWARVGGFDPGYFLYWEDVDLSWRWVRAGGELHVATGVTVVHSVGGTQDAFVKSPIYVYYNCRNRLLFAKNNLPPRAVWRWVLGTAPYAAEVLQRGGRRELIRHARPLVAAAIGGSAAGLGAAAARLVRPITGETS